MRSVLIILLAVSIIFSFYLLLKKGKSAKYFIVMSALLMVALYSIRYIPQGIKARIFPEYLGVENFSQENPLSYLNDDFNSDSLSTEWTKFNDDMLDMNQAGGKLILTPNIESVWWMKDQGPMFYKNVEGDFSFSTKVETRKASDTTSYPDKLWQFGGIILRAPSSDEESKGENYVFIVVGYRGSKLQVEVKSTKDDKSDVIGIDWPTGDAEVRISRKDNLFYMMARKNSAEEWQVMETYERPDLPAKLQAGIIVYSFSYNKGVGDLTARFDEIKFWKSDFDF
ncbi:MAG: hypothetical protein IPM56_11810 [Ignavibacteriales bacterium]|nr:MAG: hypothetical protein IPM56_11810 [Ignavibacteriales bacterium]